MATQATIDKMKLDLRISNSAYDAEIEMLIDAGLMELKKAGAINAAETDPMTMVALSSYCKSNFGMAGPDASRFDEKFEKIKRLMAMLPEYNVGAEGA